MLSVSIRELIAQEKTYNLVTVLDMDNEMLEASTESNKSMDLIPAVSGIHSSVFLIINHALVDF